MLGKTAKLIISIFLSGLGIGLFAWQKNRERKLCMIAMLLSTFGDIFMIDTFHMGDSSLYPGAAGFILAHIVYAVCFIGAGKRKGYRLINAAFIAGAALTVVAAAALYFLAARRDIGDLSMYPLLLIYLAIIGFNLACQFSYASREKGQRYFIMLGMTLFLISDFTVFLPMLNISPSHNDFVWFTYIPAQLLIILFNSDLKKGNSK